MIYSRQGRDFPHAQEFLAKKSPSPILRVGYIGQITESKGVHILFEAVRNLPGANLEVKAYGDPAPFPKYTKRLQRMAKRDKRLSLAGAFLPQNISQVFQELDVIVVPSMWTENSPNVVLEAFAHHVPVIGSNIGGIPELVKDEENGLIFESRDAQDLARKLQRLLDEPDLLQRLQKGIKPIRSTTSELDELVEIYMRVLNQEPGNIKPG